MKMIEDKTIKEIIDYLTIKGRVNFGDFCSIFNIPEKDLKELILNLWEKKNISFGVDWANKLILPPKAINDSKNSANCPQCDHKLPKIPSQGEKVVCNWCSIYLYF